MKNKPRNKSFTDKTKKVTKKAKPSSFQSLPDGEVWIWGLHAAAAALKNSDRKIIRAFFSRNAAQKIGLNPDDLPHFAKLCDPKDLDLVLPPNSVHQGVALHARELSGVSLEDVIENAQGPVLILDQVTDPQNVGAIFRSAAAFGAKAVILQTRNAPPLSGALAKASVGAIDMVPEVSVVNISRAIEAFVDAGWWVVGMAGDTDTTIDIAFDTPAPLAIVMGAEGDGLRPLVMKHCSQLAKIPIEPQMESLNVASATAIALYEAQKLKRN